MVTLSTLEKISAMDKLSDCLAMSQASVPKDQKVDVVGEDMNNLGVPRSLSRSVNQNKTMWSEMYVDPTYCKRDHHVFGAVATQNESSLFSSSLSELVNNKLKLSSNKFIPRQSSTVAPQIDEVKPFQSLEENEGPTINNLLPNEEELFSGIVDEMGHLGNATAGDDLDDFDVFTYSGGIELEGEEHLRATPRNVGYPFPIHQNQHHSIHAMDHDPSIHSTSRWSNGGVLINSSPHENTQIFNGFPSPVRMSSVGNNYGNSDNRGIPNFQPCSPQVAIHNVNVISQNSLDNVAGFLDDFRPRVSENINMETHHMGVNRHARDLNDGVIGYSPNGFHLHQSMASKSNSYKQHHPRSLLMSQSPSFMNNNHAHHVGRLPGSPHLVMNMFSPVQHHLQVGSPREIPSIISRVYGSEMSKNGGIQSPQQMSHLLHERNTMNSLPTSFGSPSERVRRSRNEINLSHADRKSYELNVDRILHGNDSRTTLMIKNIPNKYTSKMLLATIDEHHQGKYDFIYLPIDFKNKCNMGYAFINMIDPLHIVAFHQTFEGRKWEKFNSEKVACLAYARIQGKAALIAHFQNSSLMNEDKRCRPILFHTEGPNAGDQVPFPMGTNFRAKPGRQQLASSEEEE